MRPKLKYARNQVRPEAWLWLLDDDESLMDLSIGTFSTRLGYIGRPALKEKLTGFVGAVGSGNELSGTPNLKIQWVTGDLDVDPGEYSLQIEWNIGSDTPRFWDFDFEVGDVILAPV